ncbi:hypothetical protein ABBQ32_001984 [Trebouxia sp. C0010 RCD-2024]
MVEPSANMLSSFLPKASLLVGLSFVGFYSQQYLKVLGGTLPSRDLPSWRPEHKEAERRRFMNMEREAAPDDPVIMNPFRHNMPATIRNVGDLPSLESGEDD